MLAPVSPHKAVPTSRFVAGERTGISSHCLWAALILAPLCTACTELQMAGYRDEKFLEQYRYALGETYIEVDGLRMCYQERGQGDPLIILPGLGTSIDFWQLTIPPLAKHHHVIALDLPGFGKSAKPDTSYDLNWTCDRIIAFMDAKQIRQANVLGGSMGGHLGMLLALRYPERVERLVMMGSSGGWPQPGLLLDLVVKIFLTDVIVTDHVRRNWPSIYSKLSERQTPMTEHLFRYQMALRANRTKFAPSGRALARSLRSIFYTGCRESLTEVKMPVLLIWGALDRIHPVKDGVHARSVLPDSRLVIVPDAGHEVMIDQPDTFNRLILRFLEEGTQGVEDSFDKR